MAYIYSLNPRRKRKTRKAAKRVAQRPARRVVHRRRRSRSLVTSARSLMRRPRRHARKIVKIIRRGRRNPRVGVVDMLLYGAGGAVGGVAVDFLTNLVPLPSFLSSGIGLTGTKVGLGLGAGWLTEKVWKKEAAGYIASGIVAVVLHEAFGSTISGLLSSSTASTASTTSGTAGLGVLQNRLGFVNPSPVLSGGMGVLMPSMNAANALYPTA